MSDLAELAASLRQDWGGHSLEQMCIVQQKVHSLPSLLAFDALADAIEEWIARGCGEMSADSKEVSTETPDGGWLQPVAEWCFVARKVGNG